jgi:GGDEF domain-containing protein
MRAEMAELVESLQTFLASSMGSSADHQQTLRQEFEALEASAQSDDIAAIRGAIQDAADHAMKSCEELQRGQEVLIAQLQCEIRNLHSEVESERRAALSDPATGLWNRTKIDSRVKDLVLLNEGFCVFLVGLPSGAFLSHTDPRIAPSVVKALAGRLQSIAGKNGEVGMAGRWSEDVFAIVFNLPLSGAPVTPGSVQTTLGGNYAIQLDGTTRDLIVEVQVQAVERPKSSPETAFYLQLGQTAFKVTSH